MSKLSRAPTLAHHQAELLLYIAHITPIINPAQGPKLWSLESLNFLFPVSHHRLHLSSLLQ